MMYYCAYTFDPKLDLEAAADKRSLFRLDEPFNL